MLLKLLHPNCLSMPRPLALAALCALALALSACGRSSIGGPESAKSKPLPSRTVKAARVSELPMEQIISATGSLAPYNHASLSMKVPGRLERMDVDLGTAVRRGDVLAQVERRDYELRVQQSEAVLAQIRALLGLSKDQSEDAFNPEEASTVKQSIALLTEARSNRDRIARLAGDEILSPSELDKAEAAFQVAANRYQDALEEARSRHALLLQRRAEWEIDRQQLADTAITAPFDGVVQLRRASIGEYLSAGAPVLTLVQVDPLRLRLEVAERDAARIAAGQAVRFTAEGDTNVYTGRLARITPAIGDRNRMLLVEADIPNDGRLRPGSFVRAEILVHGGANALTVPRESVVTFAGIDKVILVEDGKAVERRIALGRSTPDLVEILSGVKAGDLVVLNPGSLQTGHGVLLEE
jgi:RND family efflux transporter MFP subunit